MRAGEDIILTRLGYFSRTGRAKRSRARDSRPSPADELLISWRARERELSTWKSTSERRLSADRLPDPFCIPRTCSRDVGQLMQTFALNRPVHSRLSQSSPFGRE